MTDFFLTGGYRAGQVGGDTGRGGAGQGVQGGGYRVGWGVQEGYGAGLEGEGQGGGGYRAGGRYGTTLWENFAMHCGIGTPPPLWTDKVKT